MSDNVSINPGIGGAVIATDDIAGIQYQRVKIVLVQSVIFNTQTEVVILEESIIKKV